MALLLEVAHNPAALGAGYGKKYIMPEKLEE
jgi:hypothetical protein